jgi:hypothetical protein
LAAISSDPMAHPPKTGQLFGVDMNHVPRLLPLVPLHQLFGFHIEQPAKAPSIQGPAHRREGQLELGRVPLRGVNPEARLP